MNGGALCAGSLQAAAEGHAATEGLATAEGTTPEDLGTKEGEEEGESGGEVGGDGGVALTAGICTGDSGGPLLVTDAEGIDHQVKQHASNLSLISPICYRLRSGPRT